MPEFIDRLAVEWIEIRGGQLRVRKGRIGIARLTEIRNVVEHGAVAVNTAAWITRRRSVHFKPNFPRELRPRIRAILLQG